LHKELNNTVANTTARLGAVRQGAKAVLAVFEERCTEVAAKGRFEAPGDPVFEEYKVTYKPDGKRARHLKLGVHLRSDDIAGDTQLLQ
jgi:hypothetical protein